MQCIRPQALQKKCFLAIVISVVILERILFAADIRVLREKEYTILFEPSLDAAVREVADVYPAIKRDLERVFGWKLDLRPSVLLIRHRERFHGLAKNPLTVAYAVPEKDLIVIDYSKMNIHPFNIEITLKHELCHLLIHHHIKAHILPRWLDEGICQWASDGIGEIIMDQKRSLLNKAAFRGRFIRLSSLREVFPNEKETLLLAYEESKSFIAYLIGRFGREGILQVLAFMKKGEDVDTAVLRTFSIPLGKLEKQWHHSLRQQVTWFTYLSYHLYEILFALMALITIYAFIRIALRKRSYMEEAEGGDNFPMIH